MPDKTYLDGVRDGKIEAIEERIGAYEATVQGIGDSLRDEFAKRLDPISVALLGNGDPSKGLASRFSALCSTVNTNRWLLGLVLAALVGTIIRVAVF